MRIKEGLSSQKRSSDFFAELFSQSFNHSQGSADYQYEIFCIYSLVYELLQFDNLMVKQLYPILRHIIQEHLASSDEYSVHRQVSDKEITIAIIGQLESFQTAIDSDDKNGDFYCIDRDFRYRNGRYRKITSSMDYNPLEDKYLSYFCYYGLEAHTTGLQSLDEMYVQITQFVIKNADNLKELDIEPSKLKAVINIYYEHHPQCTPNEKTQHLLRRLQ